MKNKLFILLIVLTNMIMPAYSITIPNELKACAITFVRMFVGVLVSSLILWLGLLAYKKIISNKSQKSSSTRVNNDKCEIDDTQTIEEAINTFLTINN